MKYKKPILKIASEDSQAAIYMPCIPSLDFKLAEVSTKENREAKKGKDFVYTPLVKCEHGKASADSIRGYASGKRSAILEVDGGFVRLKGCGNLG